MTVSAIAESHGFALAQGRRLMAALVALILGSYDLAFADAPPSVKALFEAAAQGIVSKSSIAVYIPVSLQSLEANAKDGCAFSRATPGGFSIALYGRLMEYGKTEALVCEANDAALIVEIHGDSKPMPDLSNRGSAQKVTLANGFAGWFVPLSCGGSCSPATLYWQTPRASYCLQMRLNRAVAPSRQLAALLDTANSLELVHKPE
jgi:hypothetical protein